MKLKSIVQAMFLPLATLALLMLSGCAVGGIGYGP